MKTKTAITVLFLVVAAGGILLWLLPQPEPPALQPASPPEAAIPSLVPPARPEPAIATVPTPRVTVPDLTNTPASLRSIIDPTVGLYERINWARALTRTLTPEEKSAVYAFLRDRHQEDDNQTGQVVKNKLMDTLCDQSPLPSRIIFFPDYS